MQELLLSRADRNLHPLLARLFRVKKQSLTTQLQGVFSGFNQPLKTEKGENNTSS